MFDIGWGELVVIGVVALIAIGPKELPGVLRALGQWTGKIRRMAAEFQGQFQEAMREAEFADLKKTTDDLTSGITNFDPLTDTKKDIERAFDDKPAEPAPATTTPAAEPAPAAETPAPPAVAETAQTLPEVNIDVPLPEPLPPVTAADFAPAEIAAPKKAGGAA